MREKQWALAQSVCCCRKTLMVKSSWESRQIPSCVKDWVHVFLDMVDALSSICKPELLLNFFYSFFSGLQDLFDSRKGKTCQKALMLHWCSGLLRYLFSSPFISVIHSSLLPGSCHSTAVSHESYRCSWGISCSACWPLCGLGSPPPLFHCQTLIQRTVQWGL